MFHFIFSITCAPFNKNFEWSFFRNWGTNF